MIIVNTARDAYMLITLIFFSGKINILIKKLIYTNKHKV